MMTLLLLLQLLLLTLRRPRSRPEVLLLHVVVLQLSTAVMRSRGCTWSPTRLLILQGVGGGGRDKSAEFSLDFSTHSPLMRCGFKTKQRIGHLSRVGCAEAISSLILVQFKVHASLRSKVYESSPRPKNGRRKFAISSINELRILPACYMMVYYG